MNEIFLDTANLKEIKEIKQWGIIKGITTNQKIFEREKGCNFEARSKEILEMAYPYPVSLEGPNDLESLVKFAEEYDAWGKNVVIKVPMLGNGDGLIAVKRLSEMGIKTNVTACMTLNQLFLAASAGATYVSLFYNRTKDWFKENYPFIKNQPLNTIAYTHARDLICNAMDMIDEIGSNTKLIIGSIRNPKDIEEIVAVGPHIITIPYEILKRMPFCQKTEDTLKEFDEAWERFCKS